MKIQKYVKDKQNKYKVIIDDEEYILYDDVIIKYNLLAKSDIDAISLREIIIFNDELKSYYESIKYINKKLRSEKEIITYLEKKGIESSVIKTTIKRLKDNNFLNDDYYLKAYLSDQINLTNNGPRKITASLLNQGLKEDIINEKIDAISSDIWENKVNKYIAQKIKNNHKSSAYMLKIKITNDLVNLGYDKEIVSSLISNFEITDNDALKIEYQKAKRQLEKKYTGYELSQHIREKLYRKGFNVYNLEEYLDEE